MKLQPSIDELSELTREWTGDRFEDGRPRVPDDVLAELREATTEHVWAVLFKAGYERQFEGHWHETNPGKHVVGRAVTAQFVPHRPDLDALVIDSANAEGRPTQANNQNWLVVEALGKDDVMVVDIFGKIEEGTVIGDNLGTALASRTGTGAVIDGGIRDLHGLSRLTDVNIFHRDVSPTPIRKVTLAGMNIPVRIGLATVLPGDVVVGTPTGVIFIPPHLAAEVAAASVDSRGRDVFGKRRLAERRYSSSQIDVPVWHADIEADYRSWLDTSESA